MKKSVSFAFDKRSTDTIKRIADQGHSISPMSRSRFFYSRSTGNVWEQTSELIYRHIGVFTDPDDLGTFEARPKPHCDVIGHMEWPCERFPEIVRCIGGSWMLETDAVDDEIRRMEVRAER